MRRLFLLRHAKTAPLTAGDDFDRELTERGRDDAKKIGAWIESGDFRLDHAIFSGAVRTRETFEIVAQALSYPFAAFAQNALYDATRALILGLLREFPAEAQSCLVVAHNPGIADVANLLAGAGDEVARLQMASKFSPGALAILAFDAPDWSGLAARGCHLERFVTPSEL